MAARQQAGKRKLDGVGFSNDDLVELASERFEFGMHDAGSLDRFALPRRVGCVLETSNLFHAPDGTAFGRKTWSATGTTRAVLTAFHGLSGEADDFLPLARYLNPLGIAVHAPEMRGQGKDPLPSRRGGLTSMAPVLADIEAFSKETAAAFPGVPLFEYGESMGAMLLVHRHSKTPHPIPHVRGLILASPVIALKFTPNQWQRMVFTSCTTCLPWVRIMPEKFSSGDPMERIMTRDTDRQSYIESAPHRLNRVSLGFIGALTRAVQSSSGLAPDLTKPALALAGGHDSFVRPEQVREFAKAAPDVEFTEYPDSYHLLLHDHDREAVLARIADWLETKIAG